MLAAQRRLVRKAISEATEEGRKIALPQAAGGDPVKLRGIPAVGVHGSLWGDPSHEPRAGGDPA